MRRPRTATCASWSGGRGRCRSATGPGTTRRTRSAGSSCATASGSSRGPTPTSTGGARDEPVNVAALLANTARSFPDRVAWIWDGRTRTYGESDRRADALARALTGRGIGPGDRVAILMDNRPEIVETMFGCWKAGLAVAPLNARFTASEIVFHVEDAGARVVVVDRRSFALVASLHDRLPAVELVVVVDDGEPVDDLGDVLSWTALQAAHDGNRFPEVDVDRDDLAWLAYTSGTTGRPKGAMLTHGVLVFEVLGMLADFFPLGVHDVGMHAAPLTHGSGHVA